MAITDIEVELTDEDRDVQSTAHRFAAEVLRPTGRELDRMVDPAEVIAEGSPLWDAFRRYRELGLDAISQDPSLDPMRRPASAASSTRSCPGVTSASPSRWA